MMEPLTQLTTKRFQVALSFAGEHRSFVEGVAEQLSRNLGQNRIFYDRYYEAELARPNLDTYLIKIYRDDTDLIAIFLCSNYTQKEWCGLEWRVVRDILKRRHDREIMSFKFDDDIVEGLLSIDGYIKINNRTPEEVAHLILQRIHGNDALSLDHANSKLSTACDEIELVLDVDFEAFTPERERRFLRALSLLLNDADVRIRRKRPGNSTILTLDLTSQQWNILKKAIEQGDLAEFKPKELLVNGVPVIASQASLMPEVIRPEVTAAPSEAPHQAQEHLSKSVPRPTAALISWLVQFPLGRFVSTIHNHPYVLASVFLCMIIISIGTFTDTFDGMLPRFGVRPSSTSEYSTSESSYYNRGVSNMQAGKLEQAINNFSQVIKINPNNSKAYYNRGVSYMKIGDYDKAIIDFSKVIDLDKNKDFAYYNRGFSYEITGQNNKAIDDFKKARELSKDTSLRQKVEKHLRALGEN